jgi:MFS family permease
LSLNNDELGILGSMVYAGIVSVGLIAGSMFLKFEAKRIILTSLAGMMMSLVLFTFQYSSAASFYALRFLTGAFQVAIQCSLGSSADLLPCLGGQLWRRPEDLVAHSPAGRSSIRSLHGVRDVESDL